MITGWCVEVHYCKLECVEVNLFKITGLLISAERFIIREELFEEGEGLLKGSVVMSVVLQVITY